jgi:hypothetical protein
MKTKKVTGIVVLPGSCPWVGRRYVQPSTVSQPHVLSLSRKVQATCKCHHPSHSIIAAAPRPLRPPESPRYRTDSNAPVIASFRMSSLPSSASTGKDSGLRVPSNGKTIYHRPLNRTKTSELSQASFAFLFSEMVAYAQKRVKGIQELEHRYVQLVSSRK